MNEYNYNSSASHRSKSTGKILAIVIPIGVIALACTFLGVFLANGGLNKLFPRLFHECEFVEWKTVEAPTCVSEGFKQRFCACGKSEEERVTLPIDSANHANAQWNIKKDPNCSESGVQDQVCMACNTLLAADVAINADPAKHLFDVLTNACSVCSKKQYQEITAASQFQNCDSKIVVLLDYVFDQEVHTLTIGSEDEYIRFVGTPGKTYRLCLDVLDRTTPIQLDFVNVILEGHSDKPAINSASKCAVNIGLYGEKSMIRGFQGASGDDYMPFRTGKNGGVAINIKGDLSIQVESASCGIYGGSGGRGGHGSIGNDGGTGGNGAIAIFAGSIKVSFGEDFTKENIAIKGGAGGAGGNAGGDFLFVSPAPGNSGNGAADTNVEVLYQ